MAFDQLEQLADDPPRTNRRVGSEALGRQQLGELRLLGAAGRPDVQLAAPQRPRLGRQLIGVEVGQGTRGDRLGEEVHVLARGVVGDVGERVVGDDLA